MNSIYSFWISLLLFTNKSHSLRVFKGNFGSCSIKTIPTASACEILKERQVHAIWNNFREKEVEFDSAKIWCQMHEYKSEYTVSTVSTPSLMDYMVLYRQKGEVFTVDSLVRLNHHSILSVSDVFYMLRKECNSMGYLQLPRCGRYSMEACLENMYEKKSNKKEKEFIF